MVHLNATQEMNAAPASVWGLLADTAGWHRWSPMDESSLERPGVPEPDGVGAIRRFRTGKIISREEVVVFDAPHHFAYTLVSGLPLRDYRADVTLTPTPTGTRVEWSSTFRPKVPGTGWLYSFMLRRFLVKLLTGLATAASERDRIDVGAPGPAHA